MNDLSLQSAAFPASNKPCLLVHGGAWDIPDEACAAHRDGLEAAVACGRTRLETGASAVDTAAAVVAAMEEHEAFDAGRGAMLNREGAVELDAGIMDGATLRYGAVIGVRRLAQPVRVAHRLLVESDGQARVLTREGAERFAVEEGFALVDNETLVCPRERARFEALERAADGFHTSHTFLPRTPAPRDTVGCVVKDRANRVAVATSTGGTPFAPAGRVGDAPLPGAGFYANRHAAASATGWGEAIAAMALSVRSVDAATGGMFPEAAICYLLAEMYEAVTNKEGEGATGGLILMSASGAAAWAFTTPRMARAGWRAGEEPWIAID